MVCTVMFVLLVKTLERLNCKTFSCTSFFRPTSLKEALHTINVLFKVHDSIYILLKGHAKLIDMNRDWWCNTFITPTFVCSINIICEKSVRYGGMLSPVTLIEPYLNVNIPNGDNDHSIVEHRKKKLYKSTGTILFGSKRH